MIELKNQTNDLIIPISPSATNYLEMQNKMHQCNKIKVVLIFSRNWLADLMWLQLAQLLGSHWAGWFGALQQDSRVQQS